MKRSHKPIFWSLFGAGGMLAALVGPMLIFLTGIAAPLGLVDIGYARTLSLAQHGLGRLALFVVIALFLFHGCHRLIHCLHDFGVPVGPGIKAAFHGFAIVGSVVAAVLLFGV